MSEIFDSLRRAWEEQPPIERFTIPQDLKLVGAYQRGQHPDDATLIFQRRNGTFFERSESDGDAELSIPQGYELRGVLQIGLTPDRFYLLHNPARPEEILKVRNDNLGEVPPLQ